MIYGAAHSRLGLRFLLFLISVEDTGPFDLGFHPGFVLAFRCAFRLTTQVSVPLSFFFCCAVLFSFAVLSSCLSAF